MAAKYLIVAGQFNEIVTKNLLEGALDVFSSSGLSPDQVKTVWVPGCYEMPVVAAKAASSSNFAGIICLGCVIRGETPHFDYVAGECASGLMRVSIDAQIPVVFGVLTTNTVDQALNRAGLKYGNKGRDAANTAIEMSKIMNELS